MGNETYKGFDRVSAILETYQAPQLIDWKIKAGKKEARRISTIATKIGTNVDNWIRADIKGVKNPKLNSVEAENCIRAWEKFKQDYQVDLANLKCGIRLFNHETKVCGEPDILMDNQVLDIKCSSSIRETYWIQTEWYARELGFGKKSILRLDKNLGIYEYEVREISEADKQVFDALTVVYRYFKPDQRSENDEE